MTITVGSRNPFDIAEWNIHDVDGIDREPLAPIASNVMGVEDTHAMFAEEWGFSINAAVLEMLDEAQKQARDDALLGIELASTAEIASKMAAGLISRLGKLIDKDALEVEAVKSYVMAALSTLSVGLSLYSAPKSDAALEAKFTANYGPPEDFQWFRRDGEGPPIPMPEPTRLEVFKKTVGELFEKILDHYIQTEKQCAGTANDAGKAAGQVGGITEQERKEGILRFLAGAAQERAEFARIAAALIHNGPRGDAP